MAFGTINIYEYNTPIVTIKQGTGKIINGNFKMIHIINITIYEDIVNRLVPTINDHIDKNSILRPQLLYQLQQIQSLLQKIHGRKARKARSINWIGSAWKWIAGSPDATDWDNLLKTQNVIIENNNNQYKINERLTAVTQEIMENYNKIIERINNSNIDKYEQMMYNKLTLIKEEVLEIVAAAQLAKKGIINTNLLDKIEIQKVLAEIETLPYSNEIEAIEYAEPIMLQKESILLYAISLPKTGIKEYNHLIIRSTIRNNKRIHLETKELLTTHDEQYSIKEKCTKIREISICNENQLQKLSPEHCISQLLKGKNASCDHQFYRKPIIELLTDNTVYVTNFNGNVKHDNETKTLNGTFLIQFDNDSIVINNKKYTNKEVTTFHILPPIIQANLTITDVKLDLEYLHDLHLENIKKLQKFSILSNLSVISDLAIYLLVIIIFIIIYRYRQKEKQTMRFQLPPITQTDNIFPHIQTLNH